MDTSNKKPVDEARKKAIRRALARADAFWGIIGKAGIGLGLGTKIGKVPFDKLSDDEKITLAKIANELVITDEKIGKEFEQAEAEEKARKEADQITVEGIAQAAQEHPTETPQETAQNTEKEATQET